MGNGVGRTVGAGGAVGEGVDVGVIVAVGASTGATVAVGPTPLQAKMPRGINATPAIRGSFATWSNFQPRNLTVVE